MTTPVAKTPEIRVEILSPSNSETEIKEQPALGFEAGALEKWEYDQDGGGEIFLWKSGRREQSEIACNFPKRR